jgi:hypothetical protein
MKKFKVFEITEALIPTKAAAKKNMCMTLLDTYVAPVSKVYFSISSSSLNSG